MQHTLLAVALYGAAALAQAASFTLSSPDIKPGASIDPKFEFNGFGCAGENKSPALSWRGAPQGTKSFAVTMYDPDAPTGSGWWHWVLADLPASVHELALGAGSEPGKLPTGAVQFKHDGGQTVRLDIHIDTGLR